MLSQQTVLIVSKCFYKILSYIIILLKMSSTGKKEQNRTNNK